MKKISNLFSILLLTTICSFLIGCGGSSSKSKTIPDEPIYTITFYANGGTGGPEDPIEVYYGEELPALSGFAPTKKDYYFAGYWDEKTGGTQYYAANMTPLQNWDKQEDATLYAKWTKIPLVEIVFNKNNADNESETKTYQVQEKTKITLNANPFTREGYTFVGWSRQPAGTAPILEDEAIYTTGAYPYRADFYAIWKVNTYTITFDLNTSNATGGPTPTTVVFDSPIPTIPIGSVANKSIVREAVI